MEDQPNTITQEPEGGDPIKIGARNNRADMARIQMMHDASVQLGAACQGEEDNAPMMENETMSIDLDETVVFMGGAVKMIQEGEGWKVRAPLVVFTNPDDPDLTGVDYFDATTDFDMEFPGKSTTYFQHGMDTHFKKRRLQPSTLTKDEFGIWAETILNEVDQYENLLIELGKKGKLGMSSGVPGHLVEREPVGKAMHIKYWPLGKDASFTHTPAEPKTRNIIPLKSLISAPEDAGSASAAVQNQTLESPVKGNEDKMTEEMKVDTKALAQQLFDDVAGRLESKFSEMLTDRKAPAQTRKPKESASWIKAFAAWAQGDNPAGFAKSNEMTFQPESMKGAWEGGTDNEGGYTVPDDFYNSVIEQRDLSSWVRQAPVQKFTTNRDRILVPTESTAATKLIVTDEEAAYNENEPVFGQVALTIYKFTKMLKISEELMEGDGVGLEKYLASTLARAAAKAENYYLTVGTGTGMPQGLAYAPTAGTMMATADTIVASDILTNRGALNAGFDVPGEVGVLMAPATWWYIKGIAGSVFQFAATPAGSPNSLLGDPVYLSPDCEALTAHSGKVITWFNYNAYAFAERSGLTVARNPYLYQADGIVGVFAKTRFGGAMLQALGTLYMPGHND